jgi:hypothetical protein
MQKIWIVLLVALLALTSIASIPMDIYDLYNGYDWNGEGWVPGLVTQETRFQPLPQIVKGAALFYGPGAMEATAEYRNLDWSSDIVDGVSLLTCAEIGHKVWLKRPGYDWEGPFLVSDCSRRNDLYAHIYFRGEVVEVGFKTAVKWGMAIPKSSKPFYTAKKWRIDDVLVSRMPPGFITTKSVRMIDWFDTVVEFAEPKDDNQSCSGVVYHGPRTQYNDSYLPLWRVNCEWEIFLPMRPFKFAHDKERVHHE